MFCKYSKYWFWSVGTGCQMGDLCALVTNVGINLRTVANGQISIIHSKTQIWCILGKSLIFILICLVTPSLSKYAVYFKSSCSLHKICQNCNMDLSNLLLISVRPRFWSFLMFLPLLLNWADSVCWRCELCKVWVWIGHQLPVRQITSDSKSIFLLQKSSYLQTMPRLCD